MWELLVGPITTTINKVIDRLWPDPIEKEKAKLELAKLVQSGELAYLTSDTQIAVEQIRVNAEEAKSGNAYAAGWRPTVGYVSIIALAYNFIGYPVATWWLALSGSHVLPPPMIDTSELFVLITGMLGIGTMRSFEKFKGVA